MVWLDYKLTWKHCCYKPEQFKEQALEIILELSEYYFLGFIYIYSLGIQ